jgi:copper chaperone NosL
MTTLLTARRLALAALLLALLAACAPRETGEPQPPQITYGQDMCDECGMLIDEPRSAAATLTTTGTARRFDDIGDMVVYHSEHPDEQVRAWFVHDYETEAWLRAETAYFVHSLDISTPMGHGTAAFADQAAAQALADRLGVAVLSFDESRAAVLQMDHAAHAASQ